MYPFFRRHQKIRTIWPIPIQAPCKPIKGPSSFAVDPSNNPPPPLLLSSTHNPTQPASFATQCAQVKSSSLLPLLQTTARARCPLHHAHPSTTNHNLSEPLQSRARVSTTALLNAATAAGAEATHQSAPSDERLSILWLSFIGMSFRVLHGSLGIHSLSYSFSCILNSFFICCFRTYSGTPDSFIFIYGGLVKTVLGGHTSC